MRHRPERNRQGRRQVLLPSNFENSIGEVVNLPSPESTVCSWSRLCKIAMLVLMHMFLREIYWRSAGQQT